MSWQPLTAVLLWTVLTTNKINSRLESFFSSTEEITIPYKDKKNTVERTFKGDVLKDRFQQSCQYIIDRILHYQWFKEKGLININNLFVNISANQLNNAIGDRKRIVSISILKALNIIEVNERYCYKSDNLLGKSFSKSYRINPEYYEKHIRIGSGDVLKGHSKANNTNKGDVLKDQITNKKDIGCRCTSPFMTYFLNNHHKLGLNEVEAHDITMSKITHWVYSPLSGMERKQRDELISKYNLVDIDIVRAHLQFLLPLINDHLRTQAYTPLFGKHGTAYFMQEFDFLKDDILNTDFYNELIKVFESKGYWNNHQQRAITHKSGKDYFKVKIKKIVMTWLAGAHKDWKMIKFLRDKYPQITHFIDWYNQGSTKRLLSKLMYDEAQLINGITEYMSINHPDSICCSIFDGFIVDQQHAQIVFEKMHSNKILDYQLKIKTSIPMEKELQFDSNQFNEKWSNYAQVHKIKPKRQNNDDQPNSVDIVLQVERKPVENRPTVIKRQPLNNIYHPEPEFIEAFENFRNEHGQQLLNTMVVDAIDKKLRVKYS